MAKQEKLLESLKMLGVEPIEGRGIISQFGKPNLSAKVASFLYKTEPFYILQLCKNELIIAQLKGYSFGSGDIKDDDPLKVEFSTIKSVSVEEKGFNYSVTISCEDGDIDLTVQQKELSNLRTSGALSNENAWGAKNWHADNLDTTLKELKKLSK